MKVEIVGCGLIGTSIALALAQNEHEIWVADSNPRNLQLAQDLIGEKLVESAQYDLTLIATPVPAIIKIIREKNFNKSSKVIDIGGIKSEVINEVEKFPDLASKYISTHPMAGRESSGPENARADLFQGRAWIVTPTKYSELACIDFASNLGKELGATSYLLGAKEHDQAMAAISHLPQILSSLMGNLLYDETQSSLEFAVQGLRDISRLADSNAQMWRDLILLNKAEVLLRIENALKLLANLQADLKNDNRENVENFFQSGKEGRSKIPGKHGARARDYSYLPIVIDDKPGQLARIFDECAICQVNIEDLSIEHSPNQDTGLITLALSHDDAKRLTHQLNENGWRVHEIRKPS